MFPSIPYDPVKKPAFASNFDGKVKSSICKAREFGGMRRTYKYAAMTKNEAQHSRVTFYEAVNLRIFR